MKSFTALGSPALFKILFFPALFASASTWAQNISIPYDLVRGPMVVMQDDATGKAMPLSPEFTRFNVVITDGFAQAKVTQVFVNRFGKVKDMAYVFPLPHDGAVHGMRMQHKDSLYIARILEKSEAQRQYDSVAQSGGQGALLLQNRPNIFEQRIANLKQGDSALVEIDLSMPLKYADGIFEFTMPTMVAERYPSDGGNASVGTGVPIADPWNPPAVRSGQSLQFNVVMQTGYPLADIASPTHPLFPQAFIDAKPLLDARGMVLEGARLSQPHTGVVTLKTQEAFPNKDFILRFRRKEAGHDFSLASHWLSAEKGGYFAFSLYPDPEYLTGDSQPLEVVLLIDISGSQYGWPLEKEKQASQAILDKLRPTDRLSVLAFSNDVTYAFPGDKVVAATPENIAKAKNFIHGLTTAGGTELLNAVQTTLALPETGEHLRYYLFFTDGFITNEDAIFQAIKSHPSKPTIFTFGAGDNLNRHFLETSAAIGNGFATEFTSTEEVTAKVAQAWERIESPQLKNLAVDFGSAQISEALTPFHDRLYKGLPYLIYGRYASGGTYDITVKATRTGTPVEWKRRIALDDKGNISWSMPKLWARDRIGRLRVDEGVSQKNKEQIIALSLEHQVLSDYTAFLAIKPEIVTSENNLNQGLPTTLVRKAMGQALLPLQWVREGLGWKLRLAPGTWLLDMHVVDISGRIAYRWRGSTVSRVSEFFWNGREESGSALKPGIYKVMIRTSKGVFILPLTLNGG